MLVILLVASLGERWLEVMHKGVLLCCIAAASGQDVCCSARVRYSSATSCFDVGDKSSFGSYVREGDCTVLWVNVDGVCRYVQAEFGGVYGRKKITGMLVRVNLVDLCVEKEVGANADGDELSLFVRRLGGRSNALLASRSAFVMTCEKLQAGLFLSLQRRTVVVF